MFRRFDSLSSVFPWLRQSWAARRKMLAGPKADGAVVSLRPSAGASSKCLSAGQEPVCGTGACPLWRPSLRADGEGGRRQMTGT